MGRSRAGLSHPRRRSVLLPALSPLGKEFGRTAERTAQKILAEVAGPGQPDTAGGQSSRGSPQCTPSPYPRLCHPGARSARNGLRKATPREPFDLSLQGANNTAAPGSIPSVLPIPAVVSRKPRQFTTICVVSGRLHHSTYVFVLWLSCCCSFIDRVSTGN